MSRRACLMSFTVALALALQGASARADFLLGGGYQLGLTNAPSTGTSQQTLDLASAKTVAANLTVTERIIQDGPNAQWVEFSFRTINGGPLAGNLGGTWRIDVLGIDLTAPGLFTDFYSYFSVNGTPFSPINPFFPGSIVAPIPTNPSLGPAFVGAISNPRPLTSIDLFATIIPFNSLNTAGVNPNTANGYTIAGRVQNVVPVPEPASLALTGLDLAGLGLIGRRIRRSTAAGR